MIREKIKFGKDKIFDIPMNAVSFGEDQAKLVFILPEDKTYEEIEADISGNDRIEILDANGEIIEAKTGYIYLDSLTKKKDYLIDVIQVETETEVVKVDEETGEEITVIEKTYTPEYVYGTVMIAVLKRSDIRQEIEEIKAIQDEMLVAMLEG